MSAVRESSVSLFDRAAEAARVAEAAYRKTATVETARLERERVTAFRRARLVRMLEESATDAESSEDAVKRQRARLCREFGWSGEAAGEQAALDRIAPVCAALAAKDGASDIAALLKNFEAWFETDRGVSFYALFDVYVQETPVVDF